MDGFAIFLSNIDDKIFVDDDNNNSDNNDITYKEKCR
jgi:hypothetical protein